MRCVAAVANRLGEGPCWSPAEGKLYWFDILKRQLFWWEPATATQGVFALPVRASAAAPRAAGGLLIASEAGLATLDTDSGQFAVIRPMDLGQGFRTNDGKIDPAGNFWWSSMDENGGERAGAVFRTTPDLETRRVLEGIHIANTISVSADGSKLYLADSKFNRIEVRETADLSKVRPFADTRGGPGTPDGSAIDAEGFLWNAQWGAARVVRYSPDGEIDRVVALPVDQPTSCAFGGPDLQILFVTSAWDGLEPAARARQPLAGALFAIEPCVKGLALPLFAG